MPYPIIHDETGNGITKHHHRLTIRTYCYHILLDMSSRREIFVPPAGPGSLTQLSPEIFRAMGEEGVFRLLEDFYHRLELSDIRSMFGDDLMESSRRAAAFYVQLFGGPPLYNTQYGNPMMRKRHLRFLIDEDARKIWLSCFLATLENAPTYGFPAEHVESFREWLDGFSRWMVNTQSTPPWSRECYG